MKFHDAFFHMEIETHEAVEAKPIDLVHLSLDERIVVKMRNDRQLTG
jgi:hypothetical protein